MEPKEQSAWPQPPSPPIRASFTAQDAGCALIIVVVLAAILWPVFSDGHKASKNLLCLSNMKWTNMALQLYAQDYDDRLPGRRWMDEANAYAKNWETFACPTVHLEDHRAYGFAFERTLAGKVTKGITKPEVQQLVYESSLLYKNTMAPVRDGLAKPGRHNRGNNVGFLDGHCKRISDGDAGKLWL